MRQYVYFITTLICISAFGQNVNKPIKSSTLRVYPVLQFAGGIGQFAMGAGYSSKNEKLTTQLLIGHVPKRAAGRTLWILTLKQTYFPFQVNPSGNELAIFPVSIGASVSFYNIRSENPDELPYLLNSTMYNYFIGGKTEIPLDSHSDKILGIYYEVGSNYIETHTYLVNRKTIRPRDIINLGLGVYLKI